VRTVRMILDRTDPASKGANPDEGGV